MTHGGKRRGSGRPVIGPKFTLRLTDELHRAVSDYAKAHGCTRAEAGRRLIGIGSRWSGADGGIPPWVAFDPAGE